MTAGTSIFYAPHADDEILSMGPAILYRQRQGERIVLVLLCDGGEDSALRCLNGAFRCQWHADIHNPAREKFADQPFDRASFVRARQNEFRQAALLLGAKPEDIHIHSFRDRELLVEQVREIVMQIENDTSLPGPKYHHTMSNLLNEHNDHIAAGQAVADLHKEGAIAQPLWYIERSQWSRINTGHRVFSISAERAAEQRVLQKITNEVYGRYRPAEAHYAIGCHSRKDSFEGLLLDCTIKAHDAEIYRRNYEYL